MADAAESPPLGEVFREGMRAADERITERHYSAIGKVAASWAYFEAVMDTMTARLMGVSVEIGTCVTSQVSGLRRLEAFIALARYRDAKAKDISRLGKVEERARSLSERRNRALHDVWLLSNPEEPLRLEATARGRLRLMSIPVPAEALLGLARDIYDMSYQFSDTADTIFNEIHSRPHSHETPK